METVNEDEAVPDDESKEVSPESIKNLQNLGAACHETDHQIVEEELMKLVDMVEETFEEIVEKTSEKDDISLNETEEEEGGQKHVHVVIQETKNEIKDLTTENKVLQRRLLSLQKRRSTIGTKLFLEGAETQYQISLKQWMDAKEELDKVMDDYNNKIDRMQEIVREKQQEARELHQEFSVYKWQVAREARHVYSGRRLSNMLLDELLKKNKELADLGKKTTHIVHVLSHSRERLEFVQKKIKADTGVLELLEIELNKARSELQSIKITCEKLRLKRERIQTTVNVRMPPLLDDMEAYRDEAKFADKKLKDLKHQYDTIVKHIQKLQAIIRQDDSTFIGCQFLQPSNNNRNLRWGASNNIHLKKPILGN